MILDVQPDRSDSPLATVPDETHATPNASRPVAAGQQDTAPPASPEAAPQQGPPATNTFEAFGSFSG